MRTPYGLVLTLWTWTSAAQTFVTPMLGGGQVAADMVHIDLFYDADANQLHAQVDDSYGIPELRPLDPGQAFEPESPYHLLNGKAYNSQYGWNVGGLFALPPGTGIWIEPRDHSPGLEVYSGWGRFGGYQPLFGTDGSNPLWKWSGVMVHNTYAVLNPLTDRLFAEYHLYFGDAQTGSRAGFETLGDTTVRLEWTAPPCPNPVTFHCGAAGSTTGAPLCFLNADQFVTQTLAIISCPFTNSGPQRRHLRSSAALARGRRNRTQRWTCGRACGARLQPGTATGLPGRAGPRSALLLGKGRSVA